MLLNEYLTSGQPLYLPPVIVGFDLSAHYYLSQSNIHDHVRLLSTSINCDYEVRLFDKTVVCFESAEIITSSNGRPKAIIATSHGKLLAITVTPPDTVCKYGEVSRYQSYPTVEIDLYDAADMLQSSQKDAVFKYLMTKRSIYRWVYNPRIREAYPQIMKRSKSYYDAAQAKMRKEAEERKAQAEEFRREQERLQKEREEQQKRAAELKRKAEENRRYIKEHEYEIGLSDVASKFTQQTQIIRDRFRNRWVKCEKCGAIKQDVEFVSYGGINHVNLGLCKECSRKMQ